jgi:uncharacterized protein (TIGR03437 family)
MAMRPVVSGLFLCLAVGWGQKPVISPAGVVNAASYAKGFWVGSIVSVFGTNLAASSAVATTVPLPTQLNGTSVTVNGIAAPLFYVSPTQINFQIPFGGYTPVIVHTPAGASDPYPVDGRERPGVFTLDGSGCGQAAVLNISRDGTVSVNSPLNSVSPGDYIAVYGTGLSLVSPAPPDGTPAPSSPLVITQQPNTLFDFVPAINAPSFAGRAPGLIGVDQINFRVPGHIREGCAVPLQLARAGNSQPVTISVRNGGGACMDPPPGGYGEITWEKTITTAVSGPGQSVTELDTLTVSLQASPGKQAPPLPAYIEGFSSLRDQGFGPSCAIPGYRSLDAGVILLQGPGFGQVQASAMPLQQGQVSGLTMYRATLASGAIQPGSFSVQSNGGADVGPIQSSVNIASGINITTSLAGRVLSSMKPITINWTGGDPGTWVTFTLVHHTDDDDQARIVQARTSDGTVTMAPANGFIGIAPGPVEVILEVAPDPAQIASFSSAGLTLGGRHSWKYTYRFEGVLLQ